MSTPSLDPTLPLPPGPPTLALFPDLTRDDVFRLETQRLWLRWPRHADAPQLAAFAGLAAVADMTSTWPHPLPKGEVERRIFDARKANATGTSLILAITPRGKPNLQIGCIAVMPRREESAERCLSLDGMLHPDHRGQGLIGEALQALIDTTFAYTATETVTADVRVINQAARRVLEKCGFRHERSTLKNLPARGGMTPVDVFLMDRKTWAALRSWNHGSVNSPVREGSVPSVPTGERARPDPSPGLFEAADGQQMEAAVS